MEKEYFSEYPYSEEEERTLERARYEMDYDRFIASDPEPAETEVFIEEAFKLATYFLKQREKRQ